MQSHKIKLQSIELNNFKSFCSKSNAPERESAASNGQVDGSGAQQHEDRHIIGPFTELTGIIGPNGVGKSNIFDAIAFALNLSIAPSKVRHIRDLAHRPIKVAPKNDQRSPGPMEEERDLGFFVKLNFLKIDLKDPNKVQKLSI